MQYFPQLPQVKFDFIIEVKWWPSLDSVESEVVSVVVPVVKAIPTKLWGFPDIVPPPQASQPPPWFVAKQQLGNNWSLKMSSIDTELLVWEILEQVYQSYWCLGLCSVPIVLTRKPIHKSISTAEAQVVVAVSEVWALLALNSCDPIKPYFSMVKPYSQILFLKIFVAHIEPLLVGNITCPKISVI